MLRKNSFYYPQIKKPLTFVKGFVNNLKDYTATAPSINTVALLFNTSTNPLWIA